MGDIGEERWGSTGMVGVGGQEAGLCAKKFVISGCQWQLRGVAGIGRKISLRGNSGDGGVFGKRGGAGVCGCWDIVWGILSELFVHCKPL